MSHISLYCLPNEILCQIINFLDVGDFKSFMETCKKFYDLSNNQVLWKSKALSSASPANRIGMLEYCDGDWYNCFREFFLLRKYIVQEVSSAHAKYERLDFINYVKPLYTFIMPILYKKCDLYYAINILIDLYKEAYQKVKELDRKIQQYVFNIMSTDMYYTKIYLAFLMHTYLITKWGHAEAFNHLLPETVLHFTLQWFDYTTFYFEEDNLKLFDNLAIEVVDLLEDKHPLKMVPPEKRKEWATNLLKENMWPTEECLQVLKAVSQVVFHNGFMLITEDLTLDTLNIQKVWKNGVSSYIIILVIYEAVARRCGVMCKLIITNDVYKLQWDDNLTEEAYTIDKWHGTLQQCRPYIVQYGLQYSYNPIGHVQYILDHLKHSDEIQVYRKQFKILTFVNAGEEASNYCNFILPCCKIYLSTCIKNEYNIRQMDVKYLQMVRTSFIGESNGPSDDSYNTDEDDDIDDDDFGNLGDDDDDDDDDDVDVE